MLEKFGFKVFLLALFTSKTVNMDILQNQGCCGFACLQRYALLGRHSCDRGSKRTNISTGFLWRDWRDYPESVRGRRIIPPQKDPVRQICTAWDSCDACSVAGAIPHGRRYDCLLCLFFGKEHGQKKEVILWFMLCEIPDIVWLLLFVQALTSPLAAGTRLYIMCISYQNKVEIPPRCKQLISCVLAVAPYMVSVAPQSRIVEVGKNNMFVTFSCCIYATVRLAMSAMLLAIESSRAYAPTQPPQAPWGLPYYAYQAKFPFNWFQYVSWDNKHCTDCSFQLLKIESCFACHHWYKKSAITRVLQLEWPL